MIKIKIQKFNPETDEKPYLKEYEIEYDVNLTVLDAIIMIKEYHDFDLAFRHSCKAGICGSCSMAVNGRARLTCKTFIKDELEEFGQIVVRPIGNLRVVKDLIVDMKPFYEEMKAVKPWFDEMRDVEILPDDVKKIEKSSECIWCAACFSDCPSRDASSEYLGPAASVLAQRYIDDIRDDKRRERLKQLVKKQLWMCAHCEKASENCPQDIEPQDVISHLRESSIKEGITGNDGARHAKTIYNSVRKKGEIEEFKLPLGTWGPFRAIKMLPLAIKMLFKGKFPPLFIKKVKKWDEMKKK